MYTKELQYSLPSDLIAQDPIPERDHSRLLVLERTSRTIEHRVFSQLADYLRPDDILVCNDTRVIPARLIGTREKTGGRVEVLLLTKKSTDSWECLTRAKGRVGTGSRFVFDGSLVGEVTKILDGGRRMIQFSSNQESTDSQLEKIGVIPLPPYIHTDLKDPERYQTIYALRKGAVASPTAGLHFTERLMSDIRSMGVQILFVTLHISLDTFRPIQEENVDSHSIFTEYCSVSSEVADALTQAKSRGSRIIAVGTTATRVLETAAREGPNGIMFQPFDGWTSLFIKPGYQFKAVDALITNFHLPKSTLLLLVGAFAGLDSILQSYRVAIEQRYRFYSFGDAMLIL